VLTAAAHAGGWPVVRGGTQRLADGVTSILRSLGGDIVTGATVRSLDELPPSRVVLCDVTPKQLTAIARDQLPEKYRRKLEAFRYGPGVFKIDYALRAPIPWQSADCARAGTLHLGGPLDQVIAAEAAPWRGEHAARPFVLMVQPTVVDPSRAPAGRHTAWAYCHVPNGSTFDMTQRIEDQIERFAPGFRDVVLARRTKNTQQMHAWNLNLIGGDIGGGANDLSQLIARPVLSTNPYATPVNGLYLCSSSTPPGGGVHGMCGHLAARAALRELR
jgi:phytoene dehydrogenase-like protein